MPPRAPAIYDELSTLIGQPLNDCWRAANMQIFEFGPRIEKTTRTGETVLRSKYSIHIQCQWRFVKPDRILFGRDDLHYGLDPTVSDEEFDWDKHESALDVKSREWFSSLQAPPRVCHVEADNYGGFRLAFDNDVALECLPCESREGESGELWRLLGSREDGSHFVVGRGGIEPDTGAVQTLFESS